MFNRGTWGAVMILLRRLFREPKFYLVLVLLSVILDEYTGQARHILTEYHINVNGWGSFACLTSYAYLMLWVVSGFLVLISDVPFASEITAFECVRLTSRQSIIARMLYIFVLSVLYTLMVFVLVCLIQFGTLSEPFKWDKALYTMSRGQSVGNTMMYIPANIVSAFSPFQAWCIATGLLVVGLTFFGLTMLCGSLLLDKRIAVCVVGVWAALDFAIGYMFLDSRMYFISPLTWTRLEMLEKAKYYTEYPSITYCLVMLFGVIVLMVGLSLLLSFNQQRFSKKLLIEGDQ